MIKVRIAVMKVVFFSMCDVAFVPSSCKRVSRVALTAVESSFIGWAAELSILSDCIVQLRCTRAFDANY